MSHSVKKWGYQLQNIKPAQIAASPYDLVVIDYANDDRPFTAAEVAVMRRRPDSSSRLVLAYLSAGEPRLSVPTGTRRGRRNRPPG
jgi:uncharacterized protein (TIGR01370 family)